MYTTKGCPGLRVSYIDIYYQKELTDTWQGNMLTLFHTFFIEYNILLNQEEICRYFKT